MFNAMDFIHANIGLCLGEILEKAYEKGREDEKNNAALSIKVNNRCPICGCITEERADGKGGKICFCCVNKARGIKK